jgi:hypothetical protein
MCEQGGENLSLNELKNKNKAMQQELKNNDR